MPNQPQLAAHAFDQLLDRLSATPDRRMILGIAAIGGAGKSTLAEQLRQHATDAGITAALVPMDGFHLPNDQLEDQGIRHLKGQPQTFDADGYVALIEQIKANDQPVTFPIYDRNLHNPVWPNDAAHTIEPFPVGPQLVITEGNYLLLHSPPWSGLANMLDEAWLLDVPIEVAKNRIIARHIRGGRSAEDAAAHYARVDGPNAQLILSHARPGHLLVQPRPD